MKYNLKNRPHLSKDLTTDYLRKYFRDLCAWFKGFEAELREEIKECELIIKKYPKDTVGIAGQLATIAKNKGILGE